MVGHTGVWEATVAALATIDACLARILESLELLDALDPSGPGTLLIVTADHGNAEEMRDAEGRPVTAHSLNPVPIVLVGRAVEGRRINDGVLADVAPDDPRAGGPGALGRDDRPLAARVIPSAAVPSGGPSAWIRSWRSARSSSASP